MVSLAIYGLGIYIMFQFHLIFAILYLGFILVLEFRLIKSHCTSCYYWGKICGFGKGRISAWFFKKGDISKFCPKEMTWKDMIPDLLVLAIPLIVWLILLIRDFNLFILAFGILFIFFTSFRNGFIRGNLTCKYCKQKEIGCPAEKLFNKDK